VALGFFISVYLVGSETYTKDNLTWQPSDCATFDKISQEDAEQAFVNDKDSAIMNCFCYEEFVSLNMEFGSIIFSHPEL
jgi:hypothetical protein